MPMNEDEFWEIVERTLAYVDDPDEQTKALEAELQSLDLDTIVSFDLYMNKLMFEAYSSELWCAAYVIQGGCSDDEFSSFCYWLISRGRAVFENTVRNPDHLADVFQEGIPRDVDLVSFGYAAEVAFENNTGESIGYYLKAERIEFEIGQRNEIQFNWTEDDPESMRKICPRLFAQCWGKRGGST
jgi:Protein of unknown function (DUF4240)